MEIQIAYCFRLISGTFNCRRKVRMIVADHDKMSPGNCGVFQLLKKVAFRRILAFYNSRKWGHFGGAWDTAYALLIDARQFRDFFMIFSWTVDTVFRHFVVSFAIKVIDNLFIGYGIPFFLICLRNRHSHQTVLFRAEEARSETVCLVRYWGFCWRKQSTTNTWGLAKLNVLVQVFDVNCGIVTATDFRWVTHHFTDLVQADSALG